MTVGMKRLLLSILAQACYVRAAELPDFALTASDVPVRMAKPSESRAARFADPPADCRILPMLHGCFPEAENARNDERVLRLRAFGFGGAVVNVWGGKRYLEDPSAWRGFAHFCEKAHGEGLTLWLYDEDGYPSGSAGERTLKGHPEFEAYGYLVSATNVPAGTEVGLFVPPGRVKQVLAFPLAGEMIDFAMGVDLQASRSADGSLRTTAPGGTGVWRVFVFALGPLKAGTHAETNYCRPGVSLPNLMQRDAVARFVELTHEAYRREAGQVIPFVQALFTDEPSLMALLVNNLNYTVFPTAIGFAKRYREKTGRFLQRDLPRIAANAKDGSSAEIRRDYWTLIAEEFSKNYFGRLSQWAKANGTLSGGHLLAEGNLVRSVPLYGDFFRCLRAFDAPGTDRLSSNPRTLSWMLCRFPGSAAELNGGGVPVMNELSETEERPKVADGEQPVTAENILGTVNKLVWGGHNVIHSYHQWKWFSAAEIRRINAVVGRTTTLMKEGRDASSVALVYPSSALMRTYDPLSASRPNADCRKVQDLFDRCGGALASSGRSFIIADEKSVYGGRMDKRALTCGGLRWKVLVVPAADLADEEFRCRLQKLRAAGLRVIAVDDRQAADGLTEALGKAVPPEVEVVNGAADVRLLIARRRTSGDDLFFVCNDSPATWCGSVRLNGVKDAVTLWDPLAGIRSDSAKGSVGLTLPPYGAVVLSAARAKSSD